MKHINHSPIRLYWGENYGPKPKAAAKAIAAAYRAAYRNIHLYPGQWQDKAIAAISTEYKLPKDQIAIGNGIEGLLSVIFRTFAKAGDEIITLTPTFGGYAHNAQSNGIKCLTLSVDFKTWLTVKDVLRLITLNTRMIFLASPNTMTGAYHISPGEIGKLAEEFSGLLVVDECYFGIGDQTALPLVDTHSNIMILRSASKSLGLAGIQRDGNGKW